MTSLLDVRELSDHVNPLLDRHMNLPEQKQVLLYVCLLLLHCSHHGKATQTILDKEPGILSVTVQILLRFR